MMPGGDMGSRLSATLCLVAPCSFVHKAWLVEWSSDYPGVGCAVIWGLGVDRPWVRIG